MLVPCPAQAARQQLRTMLAPDMIQWPNAHSLPDRVTDQLGLGKKASHKQA